MKMHEKLGMSTEDVLKWIYECKDRPCIYCKAYPTSQIGEVSSRCAAEYLLSDVPEPPKIPRWKAARTQEDIDKIFSDFDAMCKKNCCDKCNYNTFCLGVYPIPGCFFRYIFELVDAPESVESVSRIRG